MAKQKTKAAAKKAKARGGAAGKAKKAGRAAKKKPAARRKAGGNGTGASKDDARRRGKGKGKGKQQAARPADAESVTKAGARSATQPEDEPKRRPIDPGFRALVHQVAAVSGWSFRDFDDLILLTISTGGGRTQKVAIVEDRDIAGQAIARYWTVIGPSDAVAAADCLSINARLAYGALATHRGNLVMMDTQLVSDADPLEVGTSIASMAAYADRWEDRLFKWDVY